jgi:uncharacterized membrane protein (UPF0182 family)
MLYVEPVYVKSNQTNAYPLLQKVLLSYGDGGSYVTLANTLEEGIKDLVAQGERARAGQPQTPTTPETPTTPGTPNTPTMSPQLQAAATEVSAAIDAAREALEGGDFTAYGEALTRLDAAMDAFQAAQAAQPPSGGSSGGATPSPGASPGASPGG